MTGFPEILQRLKNVVAIAVLLLAGTATADDEAFNNLAQEYLEDLGNFSPAAATLIGDHRSDHLLDQVDAKARSRAESLLREYQRALSAIDRDALSRNNQVDAALLQHQLDSSLWSLTELREWSWNPLLTISTAGSSLYGLVARDFAPVEERLANAAKRMRALPRFFAQARESLQPATVPQVHAETAVAQNQGLASIIDLMIVPALQQLDATDQQAVNDAITIARDAIAEHQTWLEDTVLPQAAGDFRIGAELYDRKLAFALNSPLSRREVSALAEREYANVRDQMYELAQEIYIADHPYTYFPDAPDEAYKQAIIRAALEKAYQQLPPADGIVDIAKQQLQQAIDFVVEKQFIEMPQEPVDIIVMPEFQRGVSLAYLDPPGPLDREQSAFYAVAPLPEDWTEKQVRSFLREYNLYSIQNLTLHEAVPGHYLQLAHSNRFESPLRSVFWSGTFVEGWAVYSERIMIDAGYLDNDPLMRLINLKWYLRAITNAIIDSAIHVDGMTRDQAMKLMIEGGFQEEREAAGKWVRAQLTSAQLSTYFVGYQEHVAMRRAVEAAWGEDFTLRRYHDLALSFGSPPAKFVRALMLDEPIPHND